MSRQTSDRRSGIARGFSQPERVEVSVVVPVFNDEAFIATVSEQITRELEHAGIAYEILFVDDGSTDTTWGAVMNASLRDARIRGLRHRRNFGKAAALANGFTYARGEIVVTCDADFPYDPHNIVRVIDKVLEGWDIACAHEVRRRGPLTSRLVSRFLNSCARVVTGTPLSNMNADLKAYRRQASEDLVKFGYGELHRFFVILAAKRGYTVTEIPVQSVRGADYRPKPGTERYLRGALDFLTVFFLAGYGERPLHLMGGLGVWSIGFGAASFAYLGYLRLALHQSIAGHPLLIVGALLVISGVQLLVFGLLAEMINNLDRPVSSGSRISEVLHIDRRSSVTLAPGVQVERRREREVPTGSQRLPRKNSGALPGGHGNSEQDVR